ncbi:MAG: gephyrin-like molybdotransferase Glp [Burkholderiaceae bacterium]
MAEPRLPGRIASASADTSPSSDLPVAAALRAIIDAVSPVGETETLALRAAPGRILAADLSSPIDVPPCDNSAMDGYAMRSTDLDATRATELAVVGMALAGRPYDGACPGGSAVRIMTGAAMPAGLDTVVPQESVEADDSRVLVPPGQRPGQHRRLAGEDLATGSLALPAGRRLTAADIGLAASLGIGELELRRRVRVAFFSTGDELQSIGSPLGIGRIYDSNRYVLGAMLDRLGVEAIDLGVVPDRPEALEATMREAAGRADAIISTGGVSVGEADYTRAVMARLGRVEFWSIAMRPGRPMAFGRIGKTWYFGLPGNPVAVMVSFHFLARPALLALGGALPTAPVYARARALGAIRKRAGRTEYQRGFIAADADGVMQVELTGSQGSGRLSSMSQANCMVVLHHEQGPVAAGEWVDCLPFEGLMG